MPEVVAVLFGIPVVLVIGATLVFILGFILSMVVAIFYQPVEYVEHHMPHISHHDHRPLVAG